MIEKKTAEEIRDQYNEGILSRDETTDVVTDFVPHVVVGPASEVVADVQSDIVDVAQIVTVQDPAAFVGDLAPDLDRRLLDEGITPAQQSSATVTLTWYRAAAPTEDLVVRRGEPVGTEPDPSTGEQIIYATAETQRLPFATASSYFSLARRRYELPVLGVATVPGTAGVIGAKRLTRPLRALAGWDGVENLEASSDAIDGETAERKVERWNLSIRGEQISVRLGLTKSLFARFVGRVKDAYAVGVKSGLVTRAPVNGSPVDVYIVGGTLTQATESYLFFGRGQLIAVARAPLVSVSAVRDVSAGTTFVEGTDYIVVTGRSTQDICGIYFTAAGAAPTVGAAVTITYALDSLITELQETYDQPELDADGRDLLFLRATAVPIVIDLTIAVRANFTGTRVRSLVRTRLLDTYGLGRLAATVEGSDVNADARKVPGTDNCTINRLTRSTVPTGVADIPMEAFEYPTLADIDLIVR